MSIFHHNWSIIVRGTHTCSMATAAYRSGSCLNLRTNITDNGQEQQFTFDYSKKQGIAFSAILSPPYAPEWFREREKLWQYVEDSVSEHDALLAWESTFALPEALTVEQNIEFVKDFTNNAFVQEGLLADINIHNDHANNPHVHVMIPLIKILLNASGEYYILQIKKDEIMNNIQKIEMKFANIGNEYLMRAGHEPCLSSQPHKIPQYHQMRPWL